MWQQTCPIYRALSDSALTCTSCKLCRIREHGILCNHPSVCLPILDIFFVCCRVLFVTKDLIPHIVMLTSHLLIQDVSLLLSFIVISFSTASSQNLIPLSNVIIGSRSINVRIDMQALTIHMFLTYHVYSSPTSPLLLFYLLLCLVSLFYTKRQ